MSSEKEKDDLRASEEMYHALVEGGNDGISIIQEGVLKYVNKKLAEIIGLPKEVIIERSVVDFISPEYREFAIETYRKRQKGEAVPSRYEIDLIGKDGGRIPVEVNASIINHKGEKVDMVIVRDIRERKQLQEELLRLSNIVRIVEDSIILFDVSGRIVYVNEATLKMYGTDDKADLIGKSSFEFIAPRDREKAFADMAETLKQGYTKGQEYDVITKDGRLLPVELTVSTITGQDGKPQGFVGITRDISERRRLEAAKSKIEKEVSAMRMASETISAISDAVIITDLYGRTVQFNRAAKERFCCTKDLMGEHPMRFVVEKDIQQIEEAMEKCLRNDSVENLECIARSNDGKEFSVLINATPLKSLDNTSPRNIIWVIRDITKLKAAEEEVNRIFNRSYNMLCTAGVDGYFKRVNPAFEKTLGYSAKELLETSFLDFVHPEDRDSTFAEIQKLSKGVPTVGFKNRYRCKDGSYKWVEWDTIPVASEGLLYAVARDITDRLQVEEMRLLLSSIVESTDDGIIGLGLDGTIVSWNKAAEKIYGYTQDEVKGRQITIVFPQDHLVDLRQILDSIKRGTRIVNLDAVRLRKDGELIDVSLTISPIVDASGKIVGASTIVRDISARKEIEKRKREFQEVKSRFVSSAAHELKTPLVSIKGYSDLAVSGVLGEVPQPVKHGLEVIVRNTERMLRMINELLDIQRMDSGQLKLSLNDVDLIEVIKISLQNMEPIIENKKIQVSAVFPKTNLIIRSDKIRLLQIMDNLLSNAVKYTPENGKIQIEVSEDVEKIHVFITDTGIGINSYYLPNIFDPFSKIPKDRYAGDYGLFGIYETGLGLSVTKMLVEMHGGQISAYSDGEGKGSTFAFTIPKML